MQLTVHLVMKWKFWFRSNDLVESMIMSLSLWTSLNMFDKCNNDIFLSSGLTRFLVPGIKYTAVFQNGKAS